MTTTKIAATLAAHQGSWDSWGWHCSCGQREVLSTAASMDTPARVARFGKASEARNALIGHQAEAIANV